MDSSCHLPTERFVQKCESTNCPNATGAARDFVSQILQLASNTGSANEVERSELRRKLLQNLNHENVSNLLQVFPCTEDTYETLAEYVCPKAGQCSCGEERCTGSKVLFMLLLLIKREECIPLLHAERICDWSLPLRVRNGGIETSSGDTFLVGQVEKWRPHEVSRLCRYQWPLWSPFFPRLEISQLVPVRLPAEVSLPWADCQSIPDQGHDGNSGIAYHIRQSIVKKVGIRARHHDLVCSEPLFLIRRGDR